MKEHAGKTCKQAHPHMSHVMWSKVKAKHDEVKNAGSKKPKSEKKEKPEKRKSSKTKSSGESLRAAPTPPMVGSVSSDRGFVGLSGASPVEKLAALLKQGNVPANEMGFGVGGAMPSTPPMKLSKAPPQPTAAPMGNFKHGGEVPETGTYKLHEGEHVVPNPDDHAGGDPQTAVDKLNELLDTLTGARKDAEKFDRGNSRAGVRLRRAAVEAAKELKSLRAEVQNVKGQRKASKAEAGQDVVSKMASSWIKIALKTVRNPETGAVGVHDPVKKMSYNPLEGPWVGKTNSQTGAMGIHDYRKRMSSPTAKPTSLGGAGVGASVGGLARARQNIRDRDVNNLRGPGGANWRVEDLQKHPQVNVIPHLGRALKSELADQKRLRGRLGSTLGTDEVTREVDELRRSKAVKSGLGGYASPARGMSVPLHKTPQWDSYRSN